MKKWQWNPLRDKLRMQGASAAALLLTAGSIGWLFSPVAATGMLLYLAYKGYKHYTHKADILDGKGSPIPPGTTISTVVDELSPLFGRKKSPEILLHDVPFSPFAADLHTDKLFMTHSAFADSIAGSLFGDSGAPNGPCNRDELKWIAAHEMSHLKVDKKSGAAISHYVLFHVPYILVGASLLGLGAHILSPGTLPLLAEGVSYASAIFGAIGANIAGRVFLNYASRVREFRADRNALYLTRDFNVAASALRKVEGPTRQMMAESSRLKRLFFSHPLYASRVSRMKTAWDKMNQYEKPQDNRPGSNTAPRHAAPVA